MRNTRPRNRRPASSRRPSSSRRRKSGFSLNKKGILLICAIAAAIVIIVLAVNFAGTSPKEAEVSSDDIFADNISIQGISVGGMNAEQAKSAIAPVVNNMGEAAVIAIEVPMSKPDQDTGDETADEEGDSEQSAAQSAAQSDQDTQIEYKEDGKAVVTYGADVSGLYVDVDGTIASAMEFSNTQGKVDETTPVKDFPLGYAIDETMFSSKIEADSQNWGTPAVDASYTLETTKDEDSLTTSATPVKTEGQSGLNVDIEALMTQVSAMVASGQFETIVAPTTETQPEVSVADLGEIEVIGEYSTSFSSSGGSKEGRMYNIWKISSILNGTKIASEDTMSVNDIVGPRTEEGGWALAPGIENGVYTDQAGGGICQVSSTLYIAALKAEMKIEERVHHTIPSTYVPMGLDATISTDWPDLKLTNNTDYPMLIGINCDVPDRTVEVKIYGVKPRDYTLRFESKTIETIPAPADEYVANSAIAEGVLNKLTGPREGYVVEVYKIWYDKETGEETDRKRIYTDTYKAIGAKYEYNPNTPPEMILAGQATPAPEAPADTQQPAASPTPEPTANPTEAPSQDPAATVQP